MRSSIRHGLFKNKPERIYEFCVEVAKERDIDYVYGLRDGKVEALYLLGLISEEQYYAYEELVHKYRD